MVSFLTVVVLAGLVYWYESRTGKKCNDNLNALHDFKRSAIRYASAQRAKRCRT